ncbi:MAG: hypothetical protein ACE362_26445 [Phaeodactylibacter xiamenensis]|uniref:hypothetical protein n=1 Tax=Phaeodactylibacter xiamenensis TaxID=1524460 RepID=UPI001269DF7A|nr:hypothetical protein [Phaeodactylibacter xiamenensis]MCR9055059.1 hypothetical protein [bacterium]
MFAPPPSSKRVTSSRSDVQVFSDNENGSSPNGSKWLLLLLLGAVLASGYIIWNSSKKIAPGLIETPDGEIVLSPEREAKRDRELEEIDNAIQYALVATIDGYYPCLSCPFGIKTIYLYKGNVWKYGVTRKGEAERYPGGNYGADNLLFLPMFEGTYSECLKREKTLIYNYPLLPEAIERQVILARPPGNKYDS